MKQNPNNYEVLRYRFPRLSPQQQADHIFMLQGVTDLLEAANVANPCAEAKEKV